MSAVREFGREHQHEQTNAIHATQYILARVIGTWFHHWSNLYLTNQFDARYWCLVLKAMVTLKR